jgi:hypothetical protein
VTDFCVMASLRASISALGGQLLALGRIEADISEDVAAAFIEILIGGAQA